MTVCPMCATPWRVGYLRCECGYDSRDVAELELERDVWRKRRNISFGMCGVGFAVLLVVPAVSVGLAAAIGGLLWSAGTVAGLWSAMWTRSMNRRIKAAKTRKELPEARLV